MSSSCAVFVRRWPRVWLIVQSCMEAHTRWHFGHWKDTAPSMQRPSCFLWRWWFRPVGCPPRMWRFSLWQPPFYLVLRLIIYIGLVQNSSSLAGTGWCFSPSDAIFVSLLWTTCPSLFGLWENSVKYLTRQAEMSAWITIVVFSSKARRSLLL